LVVRQKVEVVEQDVIWVRCEREAPNRHVALKHPEERPLAETLLVKAPLELFVPAPPGDDMRSHGETLYLEDVGERLIRLRKRVEADVGRQVRKVQGFTLGENAILVRRSPYGTRFAASSRAARVSGSVT
jgi:hypothetical protein